MVPTVMKEKSILALFIDTALKSSYSRDDWSYLLGVSKPAMSQWTNDKTIPSSINLNSLLNYLSSKKKWDILGGI